MMRKCKNADINYICAEFSTNYKIACKNVGEEKNRDVLLGKSLKSATW